MRALWVLLFCIAICYTSFLVSSDQSVVSKEETETIKCHSSTYYYIWALDKLGQCGDDEIAKCKRLNEQNYLPLKNNTRICLFVSSYMVTKDFQKIAFLFDQTERIISIDQLPALKSYPGCVHTLGGTICYCFTDFCNNWENIHDIFKDQIENGLKGDERYLNNMVFADVLKVLDLKKRKFPSINVPNEERVVLLAKNLEILSKTETTTATTTRKTISTSTGKSTKASTNSIRSVTPDTTLFDATSTSRNTSPSIPSETNGLEQKKENSSGVKVWHIGAIIGALILAAIIISAVVIIIKKWKGNSKKEKSKGTSKADTPKATIIEKSIASKDPAALPPATYRTAVAVDMTELAADTTTSHLTSEEPTGTLTGDSTTTDSDTTESEGTTQVRFTVSGFQK